MSRFQTTRPAIRIRGAGGPGIPGDAGSPLTQVKTGAPGISYAVVMTELQG